MIKSWREAVKYLRRVDRSRFLGRDGSVFTCDWEALRQEMDKVDAGQWKQLKISVGYCSCGLHIPLVFNAVVTAKPEGKIKGRSGST